MAGLCAALLGTPAALWPEELCLRDRRVVCQDVRSSKSWKELQRRGGRKPGRRCTIFLGPPHQGGLVGAPAHRLQAWPPAARARAWHSSGAKRLRASGCQCPGPVAAATGETLPLHSVERAGLPLGQTCTVTWFLCDGSHGSFLAWALQLPLAGHRSPSDAVRRPGLPRPLSLTTAKSTPTVLTLPAPTHRLLYTEPTCLSHRLPLHSVTQAGSAGGSPECSPVSSLLLTTGPTPANAACLVSLLPILCLRFLPMEQPGKSLNWTL